MKTLIHFTKMHALGNDFVVIDNITQNVKIDGALAQHIANRHFGIGCDQILLVEPPHDPQLDFTYRIFNADGKEVAQCGNGARCFGRYVYEKGLTDKTVIQVGTFAGKLIIDVSDLTNIQVNMGRPQFTPTSIPLNLKDVFQLPAKGRYKITLLGNERDVTILSIGNPHCIIFVPATSEAAVSEVGAALQEHPAFPQGVNVTFLQVLARNHVKCRVYERGVGETFACGSAACAAVVSGVLQEELNREVKVDMGGGALTIRWDLDDYVYLSGSTRTVFCGEFAIMQPEELV
jgi:diaminopimelate epimerase